MSELVAGTRSNLAVLVRGRPVAAFAAGCSHRSANSQQAANNPAAAEFATAVHNKVTTDAMMAHLSKLQDIANANNGTRAVGTPGYEASVDYVVNTLRDSGFDVQTPEFSARVFHADKRNGDRRRQGLRSAGAGIQPGHAAGRGERAVVVCAGR